MTPSLDNLVYAFALSLLAGLSTGIGSGLALLTKRTNTKFLAVMLGFSAGVMLYVSFVEIFVQARETLVGQFGNFQGTSLTVLGFFTGIFAIGIIDRLIPDAENPHEMRTVEEINDPHTSQAPHDKALMRMGLFTGVAIAIHNFPEGLATLTAALANPQLGLPIAIAIAIHNIPEGIAVAVPVYFATGNKKKAFTLSFLSGLAEPVGALVGLVLILPFFSPTIFGFIFAAVAGIMVYISLDELLPSAEKYGEHHLSIYGLIAGMIVMAVSLLMFIEN